MDAYTGFAKVYDQFMDDTPYEMWAENIGAYLRENGIPEGLLLELGCGTGKMTELMCRAGYDMIGVDNSWEMLTEAKEYAAELGDDKTLYLLQDMREFELYGTVRAIISVADSMNYITEREDLVEVFKLCNNYLDPKGILIFDLKTPFFYREILGDTVIADNRENASLIWENYYYVHEKMNEYVLTIYQQEEDGRYARLEETHYQRAYSVDDIKEALKMAGMDFVEALDAETMGEISEESERIYIVARENGK